MGILDEDIQRVRETSDIVAVISEHTQLKRVGRRWQGLCPFHTEKSASFSVNAEQGLYYCFGCHAKGDVITFVREIEHVDFVGAVEKLAARAGFSLRYTDQGEQEGRKRRTALLDAVARATTWYHERLLSAPDAAKARAYLRSRGLTGDEVRRYRLGWAPEGWDELGRALRLPDQVFVDAGLGFLNRRGGQTDAFRGRVLFPIFDAGGDPVAFGGRILPGGQGPKYKNSAESAIYNKSRVLYGLNFAKAAIVNADEVVVCEGYTDVIGFAAAGVPRAVATCGTALTDDHVRVLRSYARRIVLAFDADAAGQNAAERFYAWERSLDLDVAVAAMPAGVDPGDLARSDPEALADAVRGAAPFLRFRVDRVLGAANLSTPEGRARAAEAALAVIAEHPSELVRDQYVMDVASRTRVDPDRLRSGAGAASGSAPASTRGRVVATARGPGRRAVAVGGPELEALRLLVTRPEEIDGSLHPVLFGDPHARSAYELLAGGTDLRRAIDSADADTAELLQRLAVEDTDADAGDVVVLLVREATRRALRVLESRLRADPEALELLSTVQWVMLRSNELDDATTAAPAAEQLLAWLVEQPEEYG
ncbi:MAG: DNA primase [Acidimicrobiales bacterium]|jgi:DNA primase|nr:DNA primase [Acidimicrobiales bacterium]